VNRNDGRLGRLLALVPYFLAHPAELAATAAADFGITEDQLRKDLDLLWVCGLPGHSPGDLIDLAFEGERVSVIFDAGISRPCKLSSAEALALVVALRTMAETPGVGDTDAILRALAKVEAAAGGEVDDATVEVAVDESERTATLMQRAIDDGRAVHMRYYAATRDELTDRIVDPLQVFRTDGRAYLEAWCRSAEGVRVFRLDRVERVEVLDEPASPPPDIEPREIPEGVYEPAAEHLLVSLLVGAPYRWVADYYPSESVTETESGLRVELRVADPAWIRAMVLGSGGEVAVLSPGWLADAIRDEAEAALAGYLDSA
jgi:proteasome accessory factor C